MSSKRTAAVKVGRRRIEISRPQKELFPSGVTKGDLAHYYAEVSVAMVPHVKARPVAMQRFPDGVEGEGFFQKAVPDHYPDWIRTTTVAKRNGKVEHAMVCDGPTLVYLANQACITPHVWLSRADRIDRPDRLIFDLDPADGDFAEVRRAAREIGETLRERGLVPFAMVTGKRGIHVTVPLRRSADFDRVRDFASRLAAEMAERDPAHLTTEARKAKREGRILIDIMRNAYAQHAVPPYAVRPTPTASVAVPLDWEELGDSRLRPDRWDLRGALGRLQRRGDPWEGIRRTGRTLPLD